jgi:glycosyltransferase involved in cell wall biosynthesis
VRERSGVRDCAEYALIRICPDVTRITGRSTIESPMPRVSIIIPTYNCAQYLGRAIDSACEQTYKDYEILVVDDGSTDDTKDVALRYGRKVTYLYQQNGGVSAARNHAISKASGELLAYLDADDVWYPEKLERQVAYLDVHHECGMVHSEFSIINEQDEILHVRFYEETKRTVPQGYCIQKLLKRCHIQCVTVVERRNSFDRVGAFDERLLIAQDYLHWIMIAAEGQAVGYLAEPLGKYRWRAGSLIGNRPRLLEDYVQICNILLYEKPIASRHGEECADILFARLYKVQRELAYLDRIGGRNEFAKRRLTGMIKQWPSHFELYVDLLKTYLPASLFSTGTQAEYR